MQALRIPTSAGPVSALYSQPAAPRALFVFAHGAGAGMRHGFMSAMAERLAEREVATLRYQFPYMEKGARRPDAQPVLLETVRAVVAAASERSGGVPIFAGGKSMGGRMTSMAEAAAPLGIRGIVFFGFPLHPAGRPDTARAVHLDAVAVPLLFLQGTRDALATPALVQPVIDRLGARATLHMIDTADHSFRVLRSTGRSDADVLHELADVAARWMRGVAA